MTKKGPTTTDPTSGWCPTCSWPKVAEGLRHLTPALPLFTLFTGVRGRGILRSCASSCNRSYLSSLYNAVGLTRPTLFREKGVKDT
jgi:hypothetical protein